MSFCNNFILFSVFSTDVFRNFEADTTAVNRRSMRSDKSFRSCHKNLVSDDKFFQQLILCKDSCLKFCFYVLLPPSAINLVYLTLYISKLWQKPSAVIEDSMLVALPLWFL